jgi:very-short-patch-repair endonuclease
MCDIFDPPSGEGRHSALNRINSKHVDFPVCDRARVQPRLVIELDDSSHKRQDRLTRDGFVKAVFARAGIQTINQPCKQAAVIEGVAAGIRKGWPSRQNKREPGPAHLPN